MEPSHPPDHPQATVSAIAGLEADSTVFQYFQTLNAGEFTATGALFAEEGVLHPPLDAAVVGPAAIAAYLAQEAKGMKLEPREVVVENLEDGQQQIEVKGKVHTSMFSVNVGWLFLLNPADKLLLAKVKLLASAQELLNLRR